MHFFPQVLIVANAWGAGLKYHSPADPKNEPPAPIRDAYEAIRGDLARDPQYKRAFDLVEQIEAALTTLNAELALIKLPDEPPTENDDRKAAWDLLQALDGESTSWTARIKHYE